MGCSESKNERERYQFEILATNATSRARRKEEGRKRVDSPIDGLGDPPKQDTKLEHLAEVEVGRRPGSWFVHPIWERDFVGIGEKNVAVEEVDDLQGDEHRREGRGRRRKGQLGRLDVDERVERVAFELSSETKNQNESSNSPEASPYSPHTTYP